MLNGVGGRQTMFEFGSETLRTVILLQLLFVESDCQNSPLWGAAGGVGGLQAVTSL